MSINNYKIITISHHNLNVNELEKFVIQHRSKEELFVKLSQTKSRFSLDELYYMATCNRVVFLCFTKQKINERFIKNLFFYINPEVDFKEEYLSFIQVFEGLSAVSHIFSIASSIDSLVIGEREILRQFRESYDLCKEANLMGDHLRLLEKFIVKTAKSVYSKTKIGERAVSIVSLAVQKLLTANVTENPRIIMIGAGETNSLFAKFLDKHNFRNVIIYNRSIDNAKSLCESLEGAKAKHLRELPNHKNGFDVVIACTAAMDHILDAQIYRSILGKDKNQKLIIDLAVPNNVDKSIAHSHSVKIIDIENLRDLAKSNMDLRRKEVGRAEQIITAAVRDFEMIFKQRQIEKQFSQLPLEIKSIKTKAINEIYRKQIDELHPDAQELIHEMMDYMEKKCIGIPMKVAKKVIH